MAEPGFNMGMLPSLQHPQAAVTVGDSDDEPKRRALDGSLTFLSLCIHFIYGGGTWTQNGNATISADGSGSYGTYDCVTIHNHYTSALPTATTPFLSARRLYRWRALRWRNLDPNGTCFRQGHVG